MKNLSLLLVLSIHPIYSLTTFETCMAVDSADPQGRTAATTRQTKSSQDCTSRSIPQVCSHSRLNDGQISASYIILSLWQ